ncbi:hypothetical protein LXL04_001402 [Taraxacum kok-saghyz]
MTMSNQCSNLFNYRSVSLFPPLHTPLKPYSTTLRPVFQFHNHGNLILIDRRSGNRKSALPPPIAAQSSSDLVLVATTEHRDGSLIFQFGDASEVVKKDEVVEEIESKVELECDVLKGLDNDQERGVVEKTGEYGSDTSRPTEVSDETTNTDINNDILERKTNVTSDVRDSHAESIERLSDISEEEALSSQFVEKVIESLEGVERTLGKTECTAHVDVDESLNPIVDDETDDQLSSVDIIQGSNPEVMDDKQPHVDEVETEDDCKSNTEDLMPLAAIDISDVELIDTPNENVNEEIEDMNIIDPLEAAPFDKVSQLQAVDVKVETSMEIPNTECMDVKNQAIQETSTNKKDVIVMHVEEASPILEEDVFKPAMKVSDIELDDRMAQKPDTSIKDMEEGLQDMNINEGTFTDEMPPSDPSGVEPTLDEVSQIQVSDVKLHATMEDSTIKAMEDELQQDESLQDIDETGDPLESVNLETVQVSEDEVEAKDSREKLEEVTMEVLTTQGMDVNDAEDELLQQGNSDENDVAEFVLEEEENQAYSTPVELKSFTIQVSVIEVEEDRKVQSIDDVMLQIKDVELSLNQLEAQLLQDEGVNHKEQYAEVDGAFGSSILVRILFLFFLHKCEEVFTWIYDNWMLEKYNLENSSQLEAERIEDKVSSSELAEASENAAILLATKAQVEREDIYLKGYFLSSGAALLEHPFKELTGGDDAYFVASSKWLGVASGVTQWSLEGTDPGVYAQELMRTCKDIVLNNTSSVALTNPVDLLCRGVKETNMSGSSNILIANFSGQALHVANIGDTGFIIIRHGSVYKKSSPLLHEFHFALQLEHRDDPLQLVEEYIIELEEGDIVVSATDGLFDNLYEKEIAMVVSKSLQAGMKPEEVAKVLGTRAQEVGRSAFVRSPFSDAAQAAGYTGYSGGKPDKVAVIVSLVEKISTL